MSNDDYTNTFDRAAAYPFVTPDMFTTSSLICIETSEVTPITDKIAIQTSVFDHLLDGTSHYLPAYDLLLSTGEALHDRIPVIAIGSNSSPDVMIKKFKDKAVGGDFAILQATIGDHAVVHGAFVGAKGTVPATLTPDKHSSAHITVAFLTKDQVEKLMTTEPNYDVAAIESEVELRGFRPIVPSGALVYVSPWGALTKDGQNPLILSSIPSTTPHETVTSLEAMEFVAQIAISESKTAVEKEKTTQEWFNTLGLDVGSRLKVNDTLKSQALPAVIAGKQIKGATIGDDAAKHGYPRPTINYI